MKTAKFRFAATEGANFRCKLDRATVKPCRSPQAYKGLKVGAHTFTLTATDAAGNTSAPIRFGWKVVAPKPRR
jgi:hypothetical protein